MKAVILSSIVAPSRSLLRGFLGLFFTLLVLSLATGCVQTPSRTATPVSTASETNAQTTAAHQQAQRKARVRASLLTVMNRLEKQLGKPYVRGGVSPQRGFDCSGLVVYAYNKVLDRKLPRTTRAMFRDKGLKKVARHKLRRGDLVFFRSKTRGPADHVGVYLGNNTFIEAPRSGLKIRISNLTNDYWQDHYLGARRILTNEAIL